MDEKARVGLGVLIFNASNELLLGRRINAHGAFTWGPPGGHLEFGENFEDCAIREVQEETGLDIEAPEFFAVTNDLFKVERRHYISIFMKASYSGEKKLVNREPNKTAEWKWFSLEDLPENLFLPLDQLVSGKSYANNLRVEELA